MLIGLPSNGLHTNAIRWPGSCCRGWRSTDRSSTSTELKDKTGAALMRVHRSYLAIIKKLTGAEVVKGMAHITGGGITENLPRILPKGLGASIDLASWQPPPLFEHLRSLGQCYAG